MTRPPPPRAPLADLPGNYWSQLRNVQRAGDTARSLEHVVIGPSGIHVVRYRPSVADPASGSRRHGVPVEAVATVTEDAAVVRDLLPERYRDRVRPVLCLLGAHGVAEEVRGVLVASPDTLERIVVASPRVLSTSEADTVWRALRGDLDDVAPAPVSASGRGRRILRVTAAALVAAAALVGLLVVDPGMLDAFRARG